MSETTLPIGLGVYPSATFNDVRLAVATAGLPVLVMGKSPRVEGENDPERHGFATALRGLGCDVTRRHWEPDNSQVDFGLTPEGEADRWYGLVLGGLNPDFFRTIYSRAVGTNELYGDPSRFDWLAAFELALCRKLHASQISYAWGSIQVGCVEPGPFTTTFAPINAEADSVCYHLYAEPSREILEPESVPWYARRPLLWFRECQKKRLRFPPLLGGESGTFSPWHPGISSGVYVLLLQEISRLLADWRVLEMPVLGHCAFAVGAEGTMGEQWNLDNDALLLIGHHNRSAIVDYKPQPKPKEKKMVDFTSPNHDGPRLQTLGVVLHATLGGSASPEGEYQATINWFENTASQVSAHAIVGPGGKVHRSVRPENIAWHCRQGNTTHLGVELAKAKLGDPLLPEILDGAAKVVAKWCLDYHIPIIWNATRGLAEHREMPGNDHKDVGGPFDRTDFLNRVKSYAGSFGVGGLTPDQRKAALDHLDFLWSYSKADQIVKNPAESEKVIHERIVALKVALGLQQG